MATIGLARPTINKKVPSSFNHVEKVSMQPSVQSMERSQAKKIDDDTVFRGHSLGKISIHPKHTVDVKNRLSIPHIGNVAKRIQRILTRAESVAADLIHAERDNLFNTIDPGYQAILNDMLPNKSTRLETAIGANRQVDYKQRSTDTLADANRIIDMYTKHGHEEHMYVHNGATIHTADRAGAKKLPHPTLVGGDPNVTAAGTLQIAKAPFKKDVTAGGWTTKGVQHQRYTVTVTRSSGHFRPTSVPNATVTAITAAAQVNVPAQTEMRVVKDDSV